MGSGNASESDGAGGAAGPLIEYPTPPSTASTTVSSRLAGVASDGAGSARGIGRVKQASTPGAGVHRFSLPSSSNGSHRRPDTANSALRSLASTRGGIGLKAAWHHEKEAEHLQRTKSELDVALAEVLDLSNHGVDRMEVKSALVKAYSTAFEKVVGGMHGLGFLLAEVKKVLDEQVAQPGAGTTGATVVQPSPTTPTSAHLVFVVVVCVYLTRWSAAALCEEVFTAC